MPGSLLSPMASAITSERSRDGIGAPTRRGRWCPLDQPSVAVEDPADDLADGAGLLQRLELRLGDEAIHVERRLGAEIADADEGDVGLGGSASVGWIIAWPCSIARSSGEATMTGSGIGKDRALTASAMVKMTL